MYKPPYWSFPKDQFFQTSESRSSAYGLLPSSRQDTLPASADHESICPTLMTPDGRLLSPCRQGNRGYESFVSVGLLYECYRAFTPRGSPCLGRKSHFIHCRSLLSRLKASIMWAEWNRARVPPEEAHCSMVPACPHSHPRLLRNASPGLAGHSSCYHPAPC